MVRLYGSERNNSKYFFRCICRYGLCQQCNRQKVYVRRSKYVCRCVGFLETRNVLPFQLLRQNMSPLAMLSKSYCSWGKCGVSCYLVRGCHFCRFLRTTKVPYNFRRTRCRTQIRNTYWRLSSLFARACPPISILHVPSEYQHADI